MERRRIGITPYFAARGLHMHSAEVRKPMDTDRTKDSIEQLEEHGDVPNPITDDDATLGEAGDALRPQGEEPEMDKDEAEGPVPHTTQMPR